ncbi:MAG: FkbM family methyltransferase [Gammaproteobacteria bacterium]|nr:FkbM family methyltransferase [Gammaproteobacteria bacterium]
MRESFKNVRNSLRRIVPWAFVLGKGLTLIYSSRSFLREAGYFRSVAEKRPVRVDGSPIPWMNYNAISFLEERLTPDLTIYEYGSGNSTLFFASRTQSVIAIECDRGWYDYVKDSMPSNVEIIYRESGDPTYSTAIAEHQQKFDVVIVDADERIACLHNCIDSLSERGVAILDDAQRDRYQLGCAEMRDRGFRELRLEGLKAGGIRSYRTSVFYRDGNCLGI